MPTELNLLLCSLERGMYLDLSKSSARKDPLIETEKAQALLYCEVHAQLGTQVTQNETWRNHRLAGQGGPAKVTWTLTAKAHSTPHEANYKMLCYSVKGNPPSWHSPRES